MYDIDKLKARTNKCGKPFYSPLQILEFRIKNWKEKKNWPPSLDELRQRWEAERKEAEARAAFFHEDETPKIPEGKIITVAERYEEEKEAERKRKAERRNRALQTKE